MNVRRLVLSGGCVLLASGISLILGQKMDEQRWVQPDDPAIEYGDRPVNDPITRLEKRLASGEAKLEYDNDGTGYLRSLLKNLDINIDSQVLVFSKTSFQLPKIAPWSPRAVYFNDNIAVGSVQKGDVFEIAATDPTEGVTF